MWIGAIKLCSCATKLHSLMISPNNLTTNRSSRITGRWSAITKPWSAMMRLHKLTMKRCSVSITEESGFGSIFWGLDISRNSVLWYHSSVLGFCQVLHSVLTGFLLFDDCWCCQAVDNRGVCSFGEIDRCRMCVHHFVLLFSISIALYSRFGTECEYYRNQKYNSLIIWVAGCGIIVSSFPIFEKLDSYLFGNKTTA